jgi:hypothetical protein
MVVRFVSTKPRREVPAVEVEVAEVASEVVEAVDMEVRTRSDRRSLLT